MNLDPAQFLGLKRQTVTLVPYQNQWPELFQMAKQEIITAIGTHLLDIQHIGSTSIRHTYAKPILDIAVLIQSDEILNTLIESLKEIDYHYRGDANDNGGHVFRKFSTPEVTTHLLHIVEKGNPQWEKWIFLRDYLNQHPEMAEAYANLKKEIQQKVNNNRKAYTKGKTDFIQSILEKK